MLSGFAVKQDLSLFSQKHQLYGGHLWNPSYFVATVSDRTSDQIREYIANQKTSTRGRGRPKKP